METEETIPFPPPLLRNLSAGAGRAPGGQRESRSMTPVPRSATPLRPRNFAASSATTSSPARGESLALAVASKPHVPSLEQLTEARLARMNDESFLWQTPPPSGHEMVLAKPAADASSLVPLSWRGLPLSAEFQQYALRVARGENLAPYRGPGSDKKSFDFHAGMQPDQIVALFEGMLSRDGSTYRLTKLEPAVFGGAKGFRFEYALTRKVDNVQLSGVGYAAVDRGELFAIVYMAPRLAFFGRHAPTVEAIARSAHIKS